MIKLNAIGFLGKDAQVNNTNGKSVINFNVAHSEKWTGQDGQQQQRTLWLQCSFWTEKTAVAQYLKKGTQVYIEGIPDVRTFQGQDGQTQANLTVRINSVQLLGGGQQTQPQGQQAAAQAAAQQSPEKKYPEENPDLPF